MSLELWEKNRWIDIHSPTDGEVTALIETAEHAISQAETLDGLSSAWKMKMAYDAILCCARACLFRSGYRASRTGDHYREIQSLELTARVASRTVDVLDGFRQRRNAATYESFEIISEDEAVNALVEAKRLLEIVKSWLNR